MSYLSKYRQFEQQHPLCGQLCRITAFIIALLLVAHFAMQLGTRHGRYQIVSNFAGLSIDEATRQARKNHLNLQVNDSLYVPIYAGGVVLDQLPHAGTKVKGGRTVYVTINSFAQKKAAVPYVAGRSLRQAKNMLEVAGFGIERLIYQSDMATNYVLEERVGTQRVEQGSKLQREIGSGVTLYVGVADGEQTTIVPKVVGMSLQRARSRLWEQGLNIGSIRFDEGVDLLTQKDAKVYVQQPAQGYATTLGTEVALLLTLDKDKVERESSLSDRQAREQAAEQARRMQEMADSLADVEVRKHVEELQQESVTTDATEENFF